jgi:hypothetical protein
MKILKINVFTLIVIALLNCGSVFAWDDKSTHPALTKSAIDHLEETGWENSGDTILIKG